MLALTGRRADDWLPSMAYRGPRDLDIGNTVIDEAAAWRPQDIRRLLKIIGHFAA